MNHAFLFSTVQLWQNKTQQWLLIPKSIIYMNGWRLAVSECYHRWQPVTQPFTSTYLTSVFLHGLSASHTETHFGLCSIAMTVSLPYYLELETDSAVTDTALYLSSWPPNMSSTSEALSKVMLVASWWAPKPTAKNQHCVTHWLTRCIFIPGGWYRLWSQRHCLVFAVMTFYNVFYLCCPK